MVSGLLRRARTKVAFSGDSEDAAGAETTSRTVVVAPSAPAAATMPTAIPAPAAPAATRAAPRRRETRSLLGSHPPSYSAEVHGPLRGIKRGLSRSRPRLVALTDPELESRTVLEPRAGRPYLVARATARMPSSSSACTDGESTRRGRWLTVWRWQAADEIAVVVFPLATEDGRTHGECGSAIAICRIWPR